MAATPALLQQRQDAAEQAVRTLRQAIENGYRSKHPEDVKQERAFRSLREARAFQDLMQQCERGPAARLTESSS